jgi:hypothetical protein
MRYDSADLQNHNGIIASSGEVHNAVVEHLKPLLPGIWTHPACAKTDNLYLKRFFSLADRCSRRKLLSYPPALC